MWCISMRDPVQKGQFSGGKFGSQNQSANSLGQAQGSSAGGKANAGNQTKKKTNYCWAWNKGACDRGKKCHFVDGCSYCDAGDHSLNKCWKLKEDTK